METTKLTIRVSRDVLEGAKQYARDNQTTYSYAAGGLLLSENRAEGNAPLIQTFTAGQVDSHRCSASRLTINV